MNPASYPIRHPIDGRECTLYIWQPIGRKVFWLIVPAKSRQVDLESSVPGYLHGKYAFPWVALVKRRTPESWRQRKNPQHAMHESFETPTNGRGGGPFWFLERKWKAAASSQWTGAPTVFLSGWLYPSLGSEERRILCWLSMAARATCTHLSGCSVTFWLPDTRWTSRLLDII